MTSVSVSSLAGEIVSESSIVDSMGQAAASAWLDRKGQGGTGSEIRENPILNLFPKLWVGFSRRLKKVCQVRTLQDIWIMAETVASKVVFDVHTGYSPPISDSVRSEFPIENPSRHGALADVQKFSHLFHCQQPCCLVFPHFFTSSFHPCVVGRQQIARCDLELQLIAKRTPSTERSVCKSGGEGRWKEATTRQYLIKSQ